MLYALSILYKSKIPLLATFNKIDVLDANFAMEWMRDFDKLDAALSQQSSYMASFSRSMALTLEEFYKVIETQGVSSSTGKGFKELPFDRLREQYFEIFWPEVQKKALKQKEELEKLAEAMGKVKLEDRQSPIKENS